MPYKTPEQKKAQQKAYYQANKEKLLNASKAYYKSNKTDVLKYQKEYYEKIHKKDLNKISGMSIERDGQENCCLEATLEQE